MTPKPTPAELPAQPPDSLRGNLPSPEQLADILQAVGLPDGRPYAVYALKDDQPHVDLRKGDLLIVRPGEAFAVRYRFSRQAMSFVAALGLVASETDADVKAMLWFWRRMFIGYPSRRARLRALASLEGRTPRDLLDEILVDAIVEVMDAAPVILRKVPGFPSGTLHQVSPAASPAASSTTASNLGRVGDTVRAVLRATDRELYRRTSEPPPVELDAEAATDESTRHLFLRLELSEALDMLRRPASPSVRRLIALLGKVPELWDDREELARRLGVTRNNADQLVHKLKQIAGLAI